MAGKKDNVSEAPESYLTPVHQEVDPIAPMMLRVVSYGAVADVNEALRCQPFMARIVKTEGERLYIEAKGTSGIRPGDKFKVYRTGIFYNLDLEPRTKLANMATEVVVTHVQPQFIIAELPFSGSSLAIQRDDMVVAW